MPKLTETKEIRDDADYEISVESVLRAVPLDASFLVVVGVDADGQLFITSSVRDIPQASFLLGAAQHIMHEQSFRKLSS